MLSCFLNFRTFQWWVIWSGSDRWCEKGGAASVVWTYPRCPWWPIQSNTSSLLCTQQQQRSCEIVTGTNRTPLHLSAYNYSTEAAKLLLERGAEIEARDVNNRTSLHPSAYNNGTEATKLLLERGAEFEAKHVDNASSFICIQQQHRSCEIVTGTRFRNRSEGCTQPNTSRIGT